MKLSDIELQYLCECAENAATAAGRYIQSQFDKHYAKQHKEGGDSLASQIVTEVDIKAQEVILGHLDESINKYDFGLLTEESSDDYSRTAKDYFWCIDPMDGTLPFTERRTGYAVSIALISKAGDPIVAAVYIPDLALCYAAIRDQGVTRNDQPYTHLKDPSSKTLHVYMDSSFKADPNYDFITDQLESWVDQRLISDIQYHLSFGGVRNAIGVMSSSKGCYFKFPKNSKGCGSIWDYAATRLFFEELQLPVSNAVGQKLHLNNAKTTFMNEGGILYATDQHLQELILELGNKLLR